MMRIVVCMKAVPATNEVRLDPVTHTIIRDGRQAVVNPFDAAALETAVRIKKTEHAWVTALSMGIPATESLLRDALARGANQGILLSDRAFAGADTLATSYTLAAGIRKNGFYRLIICGRMAVDGDTAQIGPELAGVLGIPCLTDVCEITAVSEEEITVIRQTDQGRRKERTELPALITVMKDICLPRMPSISGIRYGEGGPVHIWDAAMLGIDTARTGLNGSATQVVRTFTPPREQETVYLKGTEEEQARALCALCREVMS